jgi:hypothetical protein
MSREEDLAKKLEYYKELAKNDKNIDVAALMVNELQSLQNEELYLSHSAKRWGYTISLIAPPFGLIFVLKFWFSDKQDGRRAALICLALTAFSLAATTWFFNAIISSSGLNLDQLQQIKPSDFEGLY